MIMCTPLDIGQQLHDQSRAQPLSTIPLFALKLTGSRLLRCGLRGSFTCGLRGSFACRLLDSRGVRRRRFLSRLLLRHWFCSGRFGGMLCSSFF